MDPLRILTEQHGFFTRQEALSSGCSERQIAAQVRRRTWTRFRHGCYAFTDEWSLLDDVGRHRVRCDAVLRSLGDDVVLSHVSGTIQHGVDVWDVDLSRVHVTRLDGGPGRIEGDVVHHEGFVSDDDVEIVEGRQVLRAARCVLEAASRSGSEAAFCLIESGLRAGAYSDVELAERFRLMQHWPFMQHLHIPVTMADPRSGSVGESRGIWAFFTSGIPAPDRQRKVYSSDGRLIGITDWWWDRFGVWGEFDGKMKYGRILKPGQDPGDVVFAEKVREDEIREATNAKCFRLTWSDLDRPRTIRARFDRLAGRVA